MFQRLLGMACEVAGKPCLRVTNGPGAGTRLLLPDGAGVLVGRGLGCHLVLDDKRVSRVHARLWRRGARVWAQDLDALNGLFVDGERAIGEVALRAGARLGIGRFELVLEWGPIRRCRS